MKYGLGLVAALLMVSCAHKSPKGVVHMRVSDNVAHLAIKDVEPGTRVMLQAENCPPRIGGNAESSATGNIHCRLEDVSEGTITKIINSNYVEARFPAGVKVVEGQPVKVLR